MKQFTRKVGAPQQAVPADEIPETLARSLDESLDDLRHDRTEDTSDFLKRMRSKIETAMARGAVIRASKR